MIKIAFVHSVAKIGGAERVSQMLMQGLGKADFTSALVCPEHGDLISWAQNNNIASFLLPLEQPGLSTALSTLSQTFQWYKFLKAQGIDIIHTADPYCTRAVAIAAKLAGVKLLSHFHFPFTLGQLTWLLRGMPRSDRYVFCSQDLQSDITKHLVTLAPNASCEVIHNGVDVSRFSPSTKKVRESLHVGIVANLQKRKGHDEFIEMAAILVSNYTHLHFHIIGGDILEAPREPYLKQKCTEAGLQSSMTFHGQVPDVLKLLDELDIVVCASHQEAFPIAILEAMAMQKAIVSTRVNGIPEAIVDSESGLLVNAHDPSQLAQAVASLIDDESKRSYLANNARKRVVEHFGLESFVTKFEQTYKSLT
ncbi:glycosyltransferase [Glaciecola siphonariae]|uniref:Glycosyltransferase n=1 Tax=Glaciecola siphonariae TaxID=521012 RepID=A0ABV9LWU2_9ALTE